jgi:serine/threonine protein kinase
MQLGNLVGQVLDDKYLIERELGRGGMGAVYKGIHVGTDRPVAVKVIVPQFMASDEFIERFRREAKAAGRLRHPNVVDVTDFGFASVGSNRIAYLVMEYLDGCTLADILAEESTLPIQWIADILDQTCSAVDEAHRLGIIHRDLKPDNIWLEPNRRGGYTVKVLDFGLAKIERSLAPPEEQSPGASSRPVDRPASRLQLSLPTQTSEREEAATMLQAPAPATEEATRIPEGGSVAIADQNESATLVMAEPDPQAGEEKTLVQGRQTMRNNSPLDTLPAEGLTRVGSILGTPTYMSPEQCRGEALDARSDIYSLGVIAYQMVAGKPPFAGSTPDIIKQHIEAGPLPIGKIRSHAPRIMARTIMSALAKEREARPQSAAAFASAIRASLSTTRALIRQSVVLYSEHFGIFFKLSLVAHIPDLLLSVIMLLPELVNRAKVASAATGAGRAAAPHVNVQFVGLFGTLHQFVAFLISAVITGVIIRLVSQLFVAPLRPITLRPALAAVRRRLWPLLLTLLLVAAGSILGLFLLFVPGIIFYINSSLSAPVVLMEKLKGRKAIKRSKALVKRSRGTVIAIIVIQYLIPTVLGSLVLVVLRGFFGGLNPGQAQLIGNLTGLLERIILVFVAPLIATLTSLLYLKTRQAGGETLSEMLSEFESEDVPRTRWRMRMRERTSLPTPSGK